MKTVAALSIAFLGLNLAALTGSAGDNTAVLLELFTSEGCSDCPAADKLLESLDRSQPIPGADLIVLSEHVDYFNSPGWSDPWSSPANTARQADYVRSFRLPSSYTPQLIVDGQSQLVGSNAAGAREAILKAMRLPKLPVTFSVQERASDHLTLQLGISAPTPETSGATVFVALADNRDRSRVSGGENGGRTLNHVAVLRTLTAAGTVSRGNAFSRVIRLPLKPGMGTDGLRVVVFVQDKHSHIIGVTQQKLALL